MKYCIHCGNQMMDEAVICVKCGCSVHPSTAPKASPRKNSVSAQEQAILIEEKNNKTKKIIQKTERATSIAWLILGILQIVIGIITSVCISITYLDFRRTYGDSCAADVLFILSLAITIMLMGCVNILLFNENKNKVKIWNRNTIFFSVALLMVYCFTIILLLNHLFANNYMGFLIISFYTLLVTLIICLITGASILSIIDIIVNSVKQAKKNIFPAKKNLISPFNKILFVLIAFLVGSSIISASTFRVMDYIVESKLETEKETMIQTLKNDFVGSNSEDTIGECLDNFAYYLNDYGRYSCEELTKQRSFIQILMDDKTIIPEYIVSYETDLIYNNSYYNIVIDFQIANEQNFIIESVTIDNKYELTQVDKMLFYVCLASEEFDEAVKIIVEYIQDEIRYKR
ncbi:MAG: hypothetical protein IJC74_09710 [Clostridia bacterium]|nr:hypothetical protein [Clostridia bacterium]